MGNIGKREHEEEVAQPERYAPKEEPLPVQQPAQEPTREPVKTPA